MLRKQSCVYCKALFQHMLGKTGKGGVHCCHLQDLSHFDLEDGGRLEFFS
jgi:hypothetical protein